MIYKGEELSNYPICDTDIWVDVILVKLDDELIGKYEKIVVADVVEKEILNLDGVGIANLNILDREQIKELLVNEEPDYVFHLAAQSSVAYSWKNPSLTIDVNVKGCANLLDVLRELEKKPRVLLIGSGEERKKGYKG